MARLAAVATVGIVLTVSTLAQVRASKNDAQTMKQKVAAIAVQATATDEAGTAHDGHRKRSQLVPDVRTWRRVAGRRRRAIGRRPRRRPSFRPRGRRSRRGAQSQQQHEPVRPAKLPHRPAAGDRDRACCDRQRCRHASSSSPRRSAACRFRRCFCRKSSATTRRVRPSPAASASTIRSRCRRAFAKFRSNAVRRSSCNRPMGPQSTTSCRGRS